MCGGRGGGDGGGGDAHTEHTLLNTSGLQSDIDSLWNATRLTSSTRLNSASTFRTEGYPNEAIGQRRRSEERAIKFRGSMKIVDDLLYPNTSFYQKLEAHIVDMVHV